MEILYLMGCLFMIINVILSVFGICLIDQNYLIERNRDNLCPDDVFRIIINGKVLKCVVESTHHSSDSVISFSILNRKSRALFSLRIESVELLDYKYLGTVKWYHHLLSS
jgi:hypothetical protein